MLQELEILINVQEIDLRIHEQEHAKKEYPATVQKLTEAILAIQKSCEAADAKKQEAQAALAGIEEQLKLAQAGLEKSQERLNSIKTNREYDAVHAEIETNKNTINSAEGRIKKANDLIEKLSLAAKTAHEEYEKIKTENEPEIADLKAKIDSIDTTIADIRKEREAATPKISKATMRTYDQIRKSRKTGKALSIVTQTRTCTICFKMLESRLINEIKRGAKITTCQNCGSILIWRGDAHTETAA